MDPSRECDPPADPDPDRGGPWSAREFRAVYLEHRGLVRRALRQLGVEPAALDDAAQDVFVVLFRRIGDYDTSRPLRSWLWGIARGVASGYRRGARRFGRLRTQLPIGASSQTPDQIIERARAAQVLHRFLATLDEDRCAVFVMAEIEGRTGPEIAARLGANVNTVYARLRSARQKFEQAMTRRRREGASTRAVAPWWKLPALLGNPIANTAIAAPLVIAAVELPSPGSDDGIAVTPVAVAAERNPMRLAKELRESTATADEEESEMPATSLSLTALLITAPAPESRSAPTTDQDADEAARVDPDGDIAKYVFDDDDLDGEVLTADGTLIPFRRPTKHGSLLKLRPHFIPELIRMGYDL